MKPGDDVLLDYLLVEQGHNFSRQGWPMATLYVNDRWVRKKMDFVIPVTTEHTHCPSVSSFQALEKRWRRPPTGLLSVVADAAVAAVVSLTVAAAAVGIVVGGCCSLGG